MRKNNAAELATKIVGDGKRPNKYFVTIGFGWYKPAGEEEEMIQVKNSIDTVTFGPFTSKAKAMGLFDTLQLPTGIDKVEGDTMGQVMIEDRLTGVVIEKLLVKRKTIGFFIDTF